MISSDKQLAEKSRTVKSRYLSPVSTAESLPPSPNRHTKQKTSVKHTNKGSFLNGVWPSSTPKSKENPHTTTLADYLGNDRKKDGVRSSFLSKQRSCSEFNRFENNIIPKKDNSLKENHKPIFGGGSMRYTGKFRFSGRSSVSSSSSSSDGARDELAEYTYMPHGVIMPGRLSVDENELRRKSYSRMRSDSFSDDSECSDFGSPFINSPASYMAPTLSSRNSIANSPTKSTIKKAMKKANSLSLSSKWNSLAGRSESPPTMTINSPFSSSAKPPTSPSKTPKRNFLYMGLDLIKSKKNGSGCLSPLGAGSVGVVENVHQLRLLHGSYIRWRYANATSNVVNQTLENKSKNDSLQVWESVVKLQQSVLQKRLQLEKDKLEMKLNFILHSQMKMLEAWREMEMRHTSDVSMTKDCLEAVACRVPLIEGVKMDLQTTGIALRHAADLVGAIMSTTLSMMPTTCEIVPTYSELAKVAIEEKSLLEECFEHFRVISTLEIEENSLRCNIIGMGLL